MFKSAKAFYGLDLDYKYVIIITGCIINLQLQIIKSFLEKNKNNTNNSSIKFSKKAKIIIKEELPTHSEYTNKKLCNYKNTLMLTDITLKGEFKKYLKKSVGFYITEANMIIKIHPRVLDTSLLNECIKYLCSSDIFYKYSSNE